MEFKYKLHSIEIKPKCLMCKKKILEVDFEYEDYFVVFRGHTENAFRGVICFNCFEKLLTEELRNK